MEKTIPKRLYRSEKDRMIAGVAGGIAEYLGVDSTPIRLLFLLFLIAGGSGFILYILCWFFMPSESDLNTKATNPEGHIEQVADEVKNMWNENHSRTRVGTFLILLGVIFLLANLGFFALGTIFKLWPLLLLFIGWQMLSRPRK